MTSTMTRFGIIAVLLAAVGFGSANAAPNAANTPNIAGVLKIDDGAKLFSEDAVKKAKESFALWVSSKTGREVTIVTLPKLPDAEKTKYDAIKEKNDQQKFLQNYFLTQAKEAKAKGVYIAILKSPGFVEVAIDRELTNKGFGKDKETELQAMLTKGLREAAQKEKSPAEQQTARDKTLASVTEFLEKSMPDAKKDVIKTGNTAEKPQAPADRVERAQGPNIMGYVCVGIAGLAVVMVIVGIVRALMGGGGGMGPGGYGQPGMGGGGMGFFGSFLTGMLGAAAGMWMYNSFFGGSTPSAYGDTGTGSTGGEQIDNSGAGDFSGGNSGGDYYDNSGGGDFGGGGGDFGGGGGDFGGDF